MATRSDAVSADSASSTRPGPSDVRFWSCLCALRWISLRCVVPASPVCAGKDAPSLCTLPPHLLHSILSHPSFRTSRLSYDCCPVAPPLCLNSDSVRSEIMLFDPRRRERRRELGVRILEWIALQELKVRGPDPLLQSGCLHKRFPCAKNAVPVTFVSRGDKSLVGRVCWIYNGRGPRIPSSSLAERDNHSSWNCRSSGQGSHEVGCVIAKACVRA